MRYIYLEMAGSTVWECILGFASIVHSLGTPASGVQSEVCTEVGYSLIEHDKMNQENKFHQN